MDNFGRGSPRCCGESLSPARPPRHGSAYGLISNAGRGIPPEMVILCDLNLSAGDVFAPSKRGVAQGHLLSDVGCRNNHIRGTVLDSTPSSRSCASVFCAFNLHRCAFSIPRFAPQFYPQLLFRMVELPLLFPFQHRALAGNAHSRTCRRSAHHLVRYPGNPDTGDWVATVL